MGRTPPPPPIRKIEVTRFDSPRPEFISTGVLKSSIIFHCRLPECDLMADGNDGYCRSHGANLTRWLEAKK